LAPLPAFDGTRDLARLTPVRRMTIAIRANLRRVDRARVPGVATAETRQDRECEHLETSIYAPLKTPSTRIERNKNGGYAATILRGRGRFQNVD
jgi:hypothetical protein